MAEPRTPSESAPAGGQPQEADVLRRILRTPGYLKTLVLCALIGIPVSLAAFWFLVALHELEHVLWADLPSALGLTDPPWWWPFPLLLFAGTVVGLIAKHLPGAGGDVPGAGLHTGVASSAALPGILLAAAACLPFGAVLGPEAPLIALGGGLALLFRDLSRAPATPRGLALLGAAGSAAAIAAIFGNPIVAAVLLIEVAGVGGPQLFAVMLPALLSSGIGSVVFTGLGRWTGLGTGDLSLKLFVPLPRLDVPDVFWAVAIGAALAVALRPVSVGAWAIAGYVTRRPFVRTVLCALGAAACAALYALVTGRSPAEAALSGQAALASLAADPYAWGVGALLALLLFKGIAYALCLGSLRGGPVFPGLFLGAAAGVLLAPLPGLGIAPAMAAGMAAATATMLRLPVSSVLLVVLLLGSTAMMPVVILAAVVAFVVTELLPAGREPAGLETPAPAGGT
ncbi:chloride channel protein [Streptomyces sp. NPDC054904]|uniref:chloride channel protein n=1 Tax=Streptomyces sp. Isolate_45 TaxID=2950111 RepID=UPI002481E112|nr:chloride channel protein [Streptomyces sp. Isolate_45]MDA5282939.1 chloride channel protein [Streptomyces sp. Isolate_45]